MSRSTLPSLSEADVRARVGDRSFKLGQDYFRRGAIFHARRQGRTLKAECEGTSAPSYRLWARFDDTGIAEAGCSCPVGDGGYCKHVAALLLTWLHQPESFTEVEELDAALERRTREELIALIKHMVRRHPELELLLETPLPAGAGGAPAKPVDPEIYRRQARAAFRGIDYGDAYHAGASVAAELAAINEIGDGFLQRQDYASAAAVYQAVGEAVLERYEEFHDEEGDLAGVVQDCAEGLAACLAGLPPGDAARQAVLKALFDIYRADVALGGIDLMGDASEAFVTHTTADERRLLAGWVREALPRGGGWSDNWRREAYGGLLLDLEAEDLDDEAFLRICRETGRTRDLVDRLLALGRADDAAREAEQAGDYDLLMLAEVFTRHGQGAIAQRLIEDRARTSQDSRLLDWLKQRYAGQGDLAGALAMARELFRRQPSLAAYQEVRDLARRLGQWEALRPSLIEQLARTGQTVVLAQVYLDEGEVRAALDLVRAARQATPRYGFAGGYGTGMDLQVAQAAEAAYPRDAIEIYERYVEQIVEQRNRPAYGQAAQLLLRMRALYERLGERHTWERYLAGLRERTQTLRAFKVELAAAGLP